MAEEEARAATSRAFRPYQHTLKIVWSFKFLEIVLLAADDYCMVVIQYLTKAWAVWQRMSRILSWEGARPQVSGFFFKAGVQLLLLFGSDTWVVTPRMGQVIGGFQDQVAWQLTRRLKRKRSYGRWEYSSAEAEREEGGFEPTEN